MLYLISYDLKSAESSGYEEFYKAISQISQRNRRVLESAWIVDTPANVRLNASAITDMLLPYIKKGDYVFVSQITADRNGWLPTAVWEWMRHGY